MQKVKKLLISLLGLNFIGLILALLHNKGTRLVIKRLESPKDNFNNPTFLMKELAVFDTHYFYSSPRYVPDIKLTAELRRTTNFKNYVLSIKNASLIGDSNLLLVNNNRKLVYFTYKFDKKNYKTKDSAIVAQLKNFSFLSISRKVINLKSGINFVGYNSDNYYHLLYEILAKFEYLDTLNLDIKLPLIFDVVCKNIPQYRELVSFFNRTNREIIYIERNQIYMFEYLIHITIPNVIPPAFKHFGKIEAQNILFSLSSIKFLNNLFLPTVSRRNYPSKLYLSRKDSSNRRKFNETEIESYLNSIGYFSFNPLNYSIFDQLSFFYNANIIIGGSGAAFTNIFICKEHCKIICFSNYKFDLSIFSTIASLRNLDLIYITDKKLRLNKKSPLHNNFEIDINDLKQYV